MVPHSSTVTEAGQGGEPENPAAQQSWEAVAPEVSAAIEGAVAPIVKRASDDLYASVLEAAQDYLADNLAFNIGSRIDTAQREAVRCRRELRVQQAIRAELLEALEEGLRAIGDHYAPSDCYATGPLTGDVYRDLVECPACSFIAKYDAAIAKAKGGAA